MRAFVEDDFGWNTMKAENLSIVDVRNAFRVHFGRRRKNVYLLTIMVNINNNCVVLANSGESSDKVYSNCLPRAFWNIVRLEYRARMTSWLMSLTCVAASHILV